jgi:hypothetical protein
MDRDQALKHQIRQALDLEFQTAPWLRHRVIETVRQRRQRPQEEKQRDMDSMTKRPGKQTSWSLALVAVILGVAVVAGLLAAQRVIQPPVHTAAPATTTGAYLTAVHEGWGPWQRIFNSAWTHCMTTASEGMPRADLCRSDTLRLKAETQALLDRLVADPAPAHLRQRDQTLQQSLRDMQPLLDQRVAAVDRGDLASLDDINYQISRKEVRGVALAVMSIDCWPKEAQVIAYGDGGSIRCVG